MSPQPPDDPSLSIVSAMKGAAALIGDDESLQEQVVDAAINSWLLGDPEDPANVGFSVHNIKGGPVYVLAFGPPTTSGDAPSRIVVATESDIKTAHPRLRAMFDEGVHNIASAARHLMGSDPEAN
jgi:hypothetical protein